MYLEYVRPYPLGNEAFTFVRRELQHAGLTLCRHLQDLLIEQGRTITYLPPDVELERLHHFYCCFGSVFPPPQIYYERYSAERRVLFSWLVKHHLSDDNLHYVVGCDNMGSRTDTGIAEESHPLFFHDDEVYYFRHQTDSYAQPLSDLSFHVGFYPAISLLTSIRAASHPIENRTNVASRVMVDLAARPRYIVLSVYDDTGYLYWCGPGKPYPHESESSHTNDLRGKEIG